MSKPTWLVIIIAFFSIGCAHRSANQPLTLTEEIHQEQIASETSSSQEEKVASKAAARVVRDDDYEDELELLAEEFEDEELVSIADPLYYWNLAMFHFNDKFYFWVLKPVARGYKFFVPEVARRGVKNFFYNSTAPVRIVNCALQGKGGHAVGEFWRFLMNTTVGVLGFGNPAKKYPELNPPREDLGQTLGFYGIGHGFYLIWPFIGTSTLRDSVGLVGDAFLDPISYVKPTEAVIAIRFFETVNATSFRIGDYEAFKQAAIAPYEALRDAYLQKRIKQVQE